MVAVPKTKSAATGRTRIFAEKISTRVLTRPELDKAVALAREIRASGAAVKIVVHEHKRLGRGIELAALAEQLRAADIGLEFLTGELQGSHAPDGVVFTVLAALSGMEREYIRDRTLEGHESARTCGKVIGGAAVTDDAMLAVALHLRGQELSLRDIATRLVISTGKKKGQHPSPATVMRMLRGHDEKAAAAVAVGQHAPVPRSGFQANAVSIYYFGLAVVIGVPGRVQVGQEGVQRRPLRLDGGAEVQLERQARHAHRLRQRLRRRYRPDR
jgi:DNA invertase Pin-like site-specific DNA recombinase